MTRDEVAEMLYRNGGGWAGGSESPPPECFEQADAVLVLVEREVAAERERCAGIVAYSTNNTERANKIIERIRDANYSQHTNTAPQPHAADAQRPMAQKVSGRTCGVGSDPDIPSG